jgi:hypothetical protein
MGTGLIQKEKEEEDFSDSRDVENRRLYRFLSVCVGGGGMSCWTMRNSVILRGFRGQILKHKCFSDL